MNHRRRGRVYIFRWDAIYHQDLRCFASRHERQCGGDVGIAHAEEECGGGDTRLCLRCGPMGSLNESAWIRIASHVRVRRSMTESKQTGLVFSSAPFLAQYLRRPFQAFGPCSPSRSLQPIALPTLRGANKVCACKRR